MAKNLPETSRPDGAQPSGAAPDYVVGYRRPPTHTRFKKGHPKRGGRRRGQRNVRTVVEETLNQRIKIREGDRTRSLSKRDAMYLRITNDAVSGNDKAQSKVIALMQSLRLHEEPQEETNRQPVTADDAAVIADFLRRHGIEMEPTPPPENSDKLETGMAEPPSKQNKETKS